jgi:opacity protein-like surface antigen
MKTTLINTTFALASLPAFAGTTTVTADEPLPVIEPATSESDWTVLLALYGWGQALEGDIAIAGNFAPVDIGFDDILEDLDFAAMGAIEIGRGRWSFIADMNYAELSSSATTATGVEADVDLDQFLGNFMLAYQVVNNPGLRFDAFVGARVNSVGIDLELDDPTTSGLDFSDSDRKTWVDPIIGFRMQAEMSEKLFFRATGDIGGFDVSSDLTWQAMAGFGYRFTDGCSGLLGYRAIGTDYTDGGFTYDVTVQGPVIGLAFRF